MSAPAARSAPMSAVTCPGVRDADRVAEGELGAAEVEQASGDLDDLLDGDVALPRVAEAHGDVAAHGEPFDAGSFDDRREHRDRLLHRTVEVAPGERLRGAGEDRDLGHARGQGPVQAALVRHEDRIADAGLSRQRREELFGVGELRDPARVHEAGGLDRPEPRVGETGDELGLDLHRYDRGLVLQAVTRADLVDGHLGGQPVERNRHQASPSG